MTEEILVAEPTLVSVLSAAMESGDTVLVSQLVEQFFKLATEDVETTGTPIPQQIVKVAVVVGNYLLKDSGGYVLRHTHSGNSHSESLTQPLRATPDSEENFVFLDPEYLPRVPSPIAGLIIKADKERVGNGQPGLYYTQCPDSSIILRPDITSTGSVPTAILGHKSSIYACMDSRLMHPDQRTALIEEFISPDKAVLIDPLVAEIKRKNALEWSLKNFAGLLITTQGILKGDMRPNSQIFEESKGANTFLQLLELAGKFHQKFIASSVTETNPGNKDIRPGNNSPMSEFFTDLLISMAGGEVAQTLVTKVVVDTLETARALLTKQFVDQLDRVNTNRLIKHHGHENVGQHEFELITAQEEISEYRSRNPHMTNEDLNQDSGYRAIMIRNAEILTKVYKLNIEYDSSVLSSLDSLNESRQNDTAIFAKCHQNAVLLQLLLNQIDPKNPIAYFASNEDPRVAFDAPIDDWFKFIAQPNADWGGQSHAFVALVFGEKEIVMCDGTSGKTKVLNPRFLETHERSENYRVNRIYRNTSRSSKYIPQVFMIHNLMSTGTNRLDAELIKEFTEYSGLPGIYTNIFDPDNKNLDYHNLRRIISQNPRSLGFLYGSEDEIIHSRGNFLNSLNDILSRALRDENLPIALFVANIIRQHGALLPEARVIGQKTYEEIAEQIAYRYSDSLTQLFEGNRHILTQEDINHIISIVDPNNSDISDAYYPQLMDITFAYYDESQDRLNAVRNTQVKGTRGESTINNKADVTNTAISLANNVTSLARGDKPILVSPETQRAAFYDLLMSGYSPAEIGRALEKIVYSYNLGNTGLHSYKELVETLLANFDKFLNDLLQASLEPTTGNHLAIPANIN